MNEYKPYYAFNHPNIQLFVPLFLAVFYFHIVPFDPISRIHGEGKFFDKTRSIISSFSTVLSFSQVQVEMKSIRRTNSTVLSLMNGFSIVFHIPTT